jgi:predicted Zn-dependent peptidase
LGKPSFRRKVLTVIYRMPANYKTNFVPGNAYLVVVGDVNTKEVKISYETFGFGQQRNRPQITYPDLKMCSKLRLIL